MVRIEDIAGPALLLDRDALDRNIQAVARIAQDHSVAWRPHVKAHKCSALGRLQIEAGAIGQSCATLREAGCEEESLVLDRLHILGRFDLARR